MKLLYKAGDITEAHIVSGLLNNYGIETHVGGHYLQGAVGDLAAMDFATIYVADEDVEEACTVIAEYESNQIHKSTPDKTSSWLVPLIVVGLFVLVLLILAIVSNSH